MTRIIAIALLCVASQVVAAPVAKTQGECVAYADLALVVATLAKHGVAQRSISAMLPDIYNLGNADAQTLARLIRESARTYIDERRGTPREFAQLLGETCLGSGGRMDAVLGGVES